VAAPIPVVGSTCGSPARSPGRHRGTRAVCASRRAWWSKGADHLHARGRMPREAGGTSPRRSYTPFLSRGSRVSRRPPPSRVMPSTVTARQRPGESTMQKPSWNGAAAFGPHIAPARDLRWSPRPQDAEGGLEEHGGGADVRALHDERRQSGGQDVAEHHTPAAGSQGVGSLHVEWLMQRKHATGGSAARRPAPARGGSFTARRSSASDKPA
jgi:hypothetical protein